MSLPVNIQKTAKGHNGQFTKLRHSNILILVCIQPNLVNFSFCFHLRRIFFCSNNEEKPVSGHFSWLKELISGSRSELERIQIPAELDGPSRTLLSLRNRKHFRVKPRFSKPEMIPIWVQQCHKSVCDRSITIEATVFSQLNGN